MATKQEVFDVSRKKIATPDVLMVKLMSKHRLDIHICMLWLLESIRYAQKRQVLYRSKKEMKD